MNKKRQSARFPGWFSHKSKGKFVLTLPLLLRKLNRHASFVWPQLTETTMKALKAVTLKSRPQWLDNCIYLVSRFCKRICENNLTKRRRNQEKQLTLSNHHESESVLFFLKITRLNSEIFSVLIVLQEAVKSSHELAPRVYLESSRTYSRDNIVCMKNWTKLEFIPGHRGLRTLFSSILTMFLKMLL